MSDMPRHMPSLEFINVRGNSVLSSRERILSNFAPFPFVLGGVVLANVEAFVQGIKYPEGSVERSEIFSMAAREAKKRSPLLSVPEIEWQGTTVEYASIQHYRLQAAAIFAKFDQNEVAEEALLATGVLPILHDTGTPDRDGTCLPAPVFSRILVETRAYLFAEAGIVVSPLADELVYVTQGVVASARQVYENNSRF